MKRVIAGMGLAALVLTGCDDPATAGAKAAVAHELKDPASVQFREIHTLTRQTTDGGKIAVVCGELNSKNGYGAYSGFSPFYYVSSHAAARAVPDGAHAVLTTGHVQLAEDEASNRAAVKKICNAKDTIPLPSAGYDYQWADPCGGSDGDDLSDANLRYRASKKFGKDLTCEAIAFGEKSEPLPNAFTMSPAERAAMTAKLTRYLAVVTFLRDQSTANAPKVQAREALDKQRPSDAPPV